MTALARPSLPGRAPPALPIPGLIGLVEQAGQPRWPTCGSLPQRALVHISPRLEPIRSKPAFRISKERMRRLSRGDSERVTEIQVLSTLANEIFLCIHIGHGATRSTSASRRAAADHVLLGQSPGVAVGGQR